MKRMIRAAFSSGHASTESIERMHNLVASLEANVAELENELKDTYREEDKIAINSIIARFKKDIEELKGKIEVAQS